MRHKLLPFQQFKEKTINFKKKPPEDIFWRIYLLPIFAVIIFLNLITRLFQITIVKGAYYRSLAENNRIREIALEAPRGTIFDRKGFVLVYSKIENEKVKRIYQENEAFAHILGYRQLASAEEIKNDFCPEKLKLNDKVGKQGIEKIFDCLLRGKKGKKLVEVDAKEKVLKTLTVISPQKGEDLRLSIDLELQKKAFELLKEKKGAIVASKPKTGEILILVSSPSFNPQDFEEENQSAIKKYLEDKNQPLFNRATNGVYPPGSTIKPMIAASALEEKAIDEKFLVEDTGVIKAGPSTFGNWYFLQYGKTEGMVDVVKAIRRSNDIFFYKTGEKLGPEKIKKWLEKFGFGQKTKIGLDEEEGLIPSVFWKKETLKEDWFLGDTYNLSIGQGYVLITPLQVNLATAVFANGGYLCKPKLLKINNNGEAHSSASLQPECHSLNLSQKSLNLVLEGMKQACLPGGTGWPLFQFKVQSSKIKVGNQEKVKSQEIPVACKTGTAESQDKDKNPHAWFTVFAPFDNPEIVLTVLIEHGGQGSDIAAPIAKEILKSYFERWE